MTHFDSSLVAALDALLLADASALDSKNMQGWLSNYVEEDDASYICRSAENSENDLGVGFMFDDCRARLEDRVTFVNKIWAGTFQDYRTRHFVQRTHLERLDATSLAVFSNFSVFMTPQDTGVSQLLAVGRYLDTVRVRQEGGVKLKARRVELDTSVLPRYLVYPI
jgi:salicylate 5-hydroxylase small subunit